MERRKPRGAEKRFGKPLDRGAAGSTFAAMFRSENDGRREREAAQGGKR